MKKPRLRQVDGRWWCLHGFFGCVGRTPLAAYELWARCQPETHQARQWADMRASVARQHRSHA